MRAAMPMPFDVRLMNITASVLFIACGLLLAAALGWWVVRHPLLAIGGIVVQGDVSHNSVATLRANVAPRLAGNFFTVDLQKAREAFEAALRHDPDDFRSHNQLGVLLLDAGDPKQAAAHFERTLQLNPNDVKARINLGLVAYRKGDVARAVGYFEEALQIDPDDPAARRNLDMLRGR